MGKRELIALLSLSTLCLVIVVWVFLAVPWVCLQFVIVVCPDHTHFQPAYQVRVKSLSLGQNLVVFQIVVRHLCSRKRRIQNPSLVIYRKDLARLRRCQGPLSIGAGI